MENYNENKKPEKFLKEKGIEYVESTSNQYRMKCLFNNCDENHQAKNGHLYMNKSTGQYDCKKCLEKGNLVEMCKAKGWEIKDAFENLENNSSRTSLNNSNKKNLDERMKYFRKEMTEEAEGYLFARGLEKETIEYFQLGYSKNRKAIAIPHIRNGKVINIHYRNIGEGSRGYMFETGCELNIYNTDNLNKDNNPCYLFEGEFDAMVAHQLGYKNVMSVPNGSKPPTKWKEQFDGFNKIFICFDNDKIGKEGAEQTVALLGGKRCWNITLPEKDLSELQLKKGDKTKKVFDELIRTSEQKEIKDESQNTLLQSEDSVPSDKTQKFEAHTKSIGELSRMKLEETPYIVDGLIVEEDINAITAKTGIGKSLFALKMAEAISSGTSFLGQYKTKKKKVLILDLEMSEHSIVDRAQTIIENKDCEIDIFYKDNFNLGEKTDVEMLIERIKEKDYGVVIIDTFSAANLKEENSNSEMAIILQEMRRIINGTGCTVVFLHHHGKGNTYKNSDKSRGASAVADKLSSHVSLTGEKRMDDYGNERLYLTVTQEKNREKYSTQPFNIEIFWDKKINKTSFAHVGHIVEAESTKAKIIVWVMNIFPGYEKYTKKEIVDMGKEKGFGTSNIWNAIQALAMNGDLKSKIYPELSKRALYYYKKEENKLFPEEIA